MTLIGHVGIMRRENGDRSITYYVRWHEPKPGGGRKVKAIRVGRTAPSPTSSQRRYWENLTRAEAYETEKRLRSGEEPTSGAGCHIPVAIDEYLDYSRQMRAAATVEQRECVLTRFRQVQLQKFQDCQDIAQLRQKHILQWRVVEAQRVSPQRLATEATVLQGFLDWCQEREFRFTRLVALPAEERRRIRRSRPEPKFVSTQRLQIILGSLSAENPHAARILTCLAGTGTRIGEFRACQAGWWDAQARVIEIQVPDTSTKGHQRSLPVGVDIAKVIDGLVASLSPWAPERPLFPGPDGGPLGRDVYRWLAPYGLKPHDLRRWYSNTLLYMQPPCPDAVRKALLGHSLSARDRAYCDPGDVEALRPWAERISQVLAVPVPEPDPR